MAVSKAQEKFYINICRNEATVTKVGGAITGCGTAMNKIQEKGAPIG